MNAVSMPRVSKLKSNFYWVSFWVCVLLLLTFSLKCDVMRCSAGARQCCIATVKYSGSFSLYRGAVLCGGVIFELSFHMCGNKNREIFKFIWVFNYKTGIEDCITVFPFFLSEHCHLPGLLFITFTFLLLSTWICAWLLLILMHWSTLLF